MMGKGSELSRDGDWSVLRVWGEVDLSWSQDVRKQVLDAYTKAKSLAVSSSCAKARTPER